VSGGVIGARLFYVVDKWNYYAANPLQIYAFWQGGLAIWGALAGGSIAAIVYTGLNLNVNSVSDLEKRKRKYEAVPGCA
jgi:prolipoprotein diacylglyceryltransferase